MTAKQKAGILAVSGVVYPVPIEQPLISREHKLIQHRKAAFRTDVKAEATGRDLRHLLG